KAYEELNRFNWSEKEFIAYEQEIKRIRDEKAVLAQKLDDAREKGIEIGRQEGIQIGEERGIKIGAEKEKIEVAKNLLKAGVSVDLITESTGLPKAEIARLKEEVTS
ncbi:MAG: Rpn family recombination-promoting nuclease/putative transposase, partial [Wolbachia sp.]